MATKTLTIMEDAYELLKRHKMKGESFTDVIKREFTKKRSIGELAGAWSDLDKKELEEIKENIKDMRKRFTKEVLKRSKW